MARHAPEGRRRGARALAAGAAAGTGKCLRRDALQRHGRWQAAAATARPGRSRGSGRASRALARRGAATGAACCLRHRTHPHLLAGPRRSARHGRRHAAPRASNRACRLRRRHGDSVGRRTVDGSVLAARARATRFDHGGCDGAGAPQAAGGRRHRRSGRRCGNGRRPGDRSAGSHAGRDAARQRKACAPCTRERPARSSAARPSPEH